jgi:hypothetical protein
MKPEPMYMFVLQLGVMWFIGALCGVYIERRRR